MNPTKPRTVAAQILFSVAHSGTNLDDALNQYLKQSSTESHAFIKALCFGALRLYPRLLFFLGHLLDKPIKNKEKLIECLLLAGIHELYYMQTPAHACVSECVNSTNDLNKQWARGLVNAVLRKADKQREELLLLADASEGARTAHPKWLLKKIKSTWPLEYEGIIEANNRPGPLTLRVNQQKTSRDEYLKLLATAEIVATDCEHSPVGIQCEQAVDVSQLPNFAEGFVSVQDQAAQLAALLLQPQNGERILDACAAPGGKTAHLLEQNPQIKLYALDKVRSRLQKVNENLKRLGLNATVVEGDACEPEQWWDGEPFDRILLDAPCSATGVIRRHPDIKLLRRAEDIVQLSKIQSQMLSKLWPLLKSGGMLLYSTCSILAEENDQQIQDFVQNNDNAEAQLLHADWGHERACGRQILPGESGMDGFFYAILHKT